MGVIHGIEPGTEPSELQAHLRAPNHSILYARMLGQTPTPVITFEGTLYATGLYNMPARRAPSRCLPKSRFQQLPNVRTSMQKRRSRLQVHVRTLPRRPPYGRQDMHGVTTKAHTPPRGDPRRERGTASWNFATKPVVKAFNFSGSLPPDPFQTEAAFPSQSQAHSTSKPHSQSKRRTSSKSQGAFPIHVQGTVRNLGRRLQVPAPFPVSEPFPDQLQVCLQIWPWTQLREPVQIQFQTTNVDQESRRPAGTRHRCHQGELGGACSAASHCSNSSPVS
ncbi:hypothetical protein HPB48_009426 [Haemaphysalis longicornis]|uniref:Uncharacterized protein n=1 Tax=Haemaphysalis longicornis TaxID=44386 RepID=A0A9J6GB06_HAELO|nr:hypothetical protein HPB48_009426 [Haemaphysalis longicornis]